MNPRDEKCPCCASTKIRIVDTGPKYECTNCLCVFVRANSESDTVQVPRELWEKVKDALFMYEKIGRADCLPYQEQKDFGAETLDAIKKAGLL